MRNFNLVFVSAIILIFTLLSSCTHGWKSYIVKAGHHTGNDISPIKLNMDKISFDFKTNNTWYYKMPANAGWNKIRGISQGHHQNNSSARLAYACLHDTLLVVGAYCYVDGVSPQDNTSQKFILDTIQPGKTYHCKISRTNDKYIFEFEDKKWETRAGRDLNWGYILNPYVGGTFTLDHDWLIEIRDR